MEVPTPCGVQTEGEDPMDYSKAQVSIPLDEATADFLQRSSSLEEHLRKDTHWYSPADIQRATRAFADLLRAWVVVQQAASHEYRRRSDDTDRRNERLNQSMKKATWVMAGFTIVIALATAAQVSLAWVRSPAPIVVMAPSQPELHPLPVESDPMACLPSERP